MHIARGRRFALPTFSAAFVLAGTLIGSTGIASAQVPDEVADSSSAHKLAKQSGKSIIIGSETSETTQVKANPDGTRTRVEYTHPVRVKQQGAWASVDLSLVPQADGTLAPKAAPVTMSFTAGGPGSAAKPVARLVKGDAEVGFGWETDLPAARISGQTATYPEILPGVDLEVRAALTGFAQNLVVKTAEAAKNPKLQTITFKSHTKNTTISKAPAPAGVATRSAGAPSPEGLVVTGPDGNQVFGGDASRMWDSSGEGRQAVMGVDVGANTITVTPDQAFLADPATTYPVRLDPDYYCTTCSKAHHAVVQDSWPNATNFDRTDGAFGDLKAGYVNAGELGAAAAGRSRTYFQMHMHGITGKYIHSATMHAKVIKSYSCDPTPTELWLTYGIGTSTSWNNQPAWDQRLSENNKRNHPVYCATDGGADFDATAAVIKAASCECPLTTFMFKAKDENSLDASWRRFDLNPYLEVRYNSYPNVPTDLGMQGWGSNRVDALPCITGDGRPAVNTRTQLRLRARVSDPDGDLLRDSGFAVHRGQANDWVTDLVARDVPSGSFAEVTVSKELLAENRVYNWLVYAGDGEARSPYSQRCEFRVDSVSPSTPAVSSTDYPTTGFNGSVGRTGIFTFAPNGNTGPDGTMDVVRYGWSLNVNTFDSRVDVTDASGVVSVPITPKTGQTNVLYVQAYDKAGNQAATPQRYVFNVADPSGPVAAWNFDELAGTTAADKTSKGHPLTLHGGASFGTGYANNGQVNTGSSFSTTSSALVDTSRAFSVSAWVKLDNLNSSYTIASQDGNRASGFYLQYADDVNRWSLSAVSSDQDSPGSARTVSTSPPKSGVWTHLLGTYEPNSHKLSLYVNGKLEGTANATLWNATGPFVVGAAKWMGERSHNVPGTIDHVQVWDRALSAAEAAKQNNFAVLRAHYNLDERTDTSTKDEVTSQNGTLSGGVTWAGTPADPDDPNQILSSRDKWLNFDSSGTGEVTGPRSVNLRTDRSYTVSAWVRHSGFDNTMQVAVSMGDGTHSPFLLGYRPEWGRWGFLLSSSPSGGGSSAFSDQVAEVGKWVHLAATFDATTGAIALYVNGIKQNTFDRSATGLHSFDASGDFWVGRGTWSGQRFGLRGVDVDDARIYSGVLSPEDVTDLYSATKHF